jgi:hypothetical protein
MPPSVATSQLPKDSAHAMKEPLRAGALWPFLERCCTNNTHFGFDFPGKVLMQKGIFALFHFEV